MTCWLFLFSMSLSFICVRVSQHQHYWHFGLDNYFLWGAALLILRCLAYLWSLPLLQDVVRTRTMSPDIAKCPLVDKIAPSWEPFVCITVHSWRVFSFTDTNDFIFWICYYWFIHSVDEICISSSFCYYKPCYYEDICAWPLVNGL